MSSEEKGTMNTVGNMYYLTVKDYAQAIGVLREYTVIILLSFAKHSSLLRESIIRNFIARGITCLESILHIYQLNNLQDCWTLHRSLLDRLFHLRALQDEAAFETFEKWSFVQRFEAKNRAFSDPSGKQKLGPELLGFTEDEKKRYAKLKREQICWSRPKAEKVAKKMDLPFLYKYGYDYGSTHVHPMADDGEEDFQKLVGLLSGPRLGQVVVLHNSFLVQVLLIQEALNASSLHWRAIIYDFLDHCILLLENGSDEYLTTFAKIANQDSDFKWCTFPSNKQVGT
jgi:hypothetical protein